MAAFVSASSLVLYLATLAPTITWRFSGADSGELAAAAYTWGIAHPTGYPLWTLLGYLLTRVPIADPAARTNLLSALCGAGTAGLVALAALRLSADLPVPVPSHSARLVAAATAGLALAAAPAFWSQAIITEVYTLNTLLIAVVIRLLAGWRPESGSPRALVFSGGLALTNHTTAIFAVLPAILVVTRWRGGPMPRGLLRLLPLFTLPLTLYLLIPWRAAQHPAENWNDPRTLRRFYELVTGAQYHYLVDWRDPLGAIESLPAILRLIIEQFAWWALPLTIYALLLLWQRKRPFVLFCLAATGADILFTAIYRAEGAQYYLLPAYAVLAVLFGVGLAAVAGEFGAWGAARRHGAVSCSALVALAVFSVAPLAAVRFAGQDLRHDYRASTFAFNTLAAAPPGATIRTDHDDQTFALWYVQRVKHFRTDVRVIDSRLERR